AELQNFASGSGDLNTQIDSLQSDVRRTRTALSGTDDLLAEYREATTEAGLLAAETRDQLSGSMTRMRIVLIALAALLALSQYVPWTLAALIETRREEPRDVVVVAPHVVDLDEHDPSPAAAIHGSPTASGG
ncbi:MAG TPA: hypothetical protein VFD53_05395, partial [Ilumatobacter sp.]|nr:hypothetical protein [Ilumatobacter sp.]